MGESTAREGRAGRAVAALAGRYRDPAVYLLLFALCTAAYHGIYDDGLFNDDYSWMAKARYEMSWSDIPTFRVVNFFRPVVNLSFFLFEKLAPGNVPLQYRFQVVLHLICCVLVYHIFLRVTRSALESIAGASLFAVTSVHTGAVMWISARTTLLSSALLLGAVLTLLRPSCVRLSTAASTGLFILALLSTEKAAAGLPILFLLFALFGKDRFRAIGRTALLSWTAALAAYIAVRTPLVGLAARHDWSIGWHMLRNIGGGLLYQFYPWPAASLFVPRWTRILEPTHPFLPEAAALGLIAIVWWTGRFTGRARAFLLGAGWAVAALIPASAFQYRFFSTASITQNRYYYLSSVGTVLILAMIAGAVWKRGRFAEWAVAAVVLVSAAGYMVRTGRLEKVWDSFTRMYTESVSVIISTVEQEDGFDTVVLKEPPLAFPYVAQAIELRRPSWSTFEADGYEAAASYRPCVYILFEYDGDRVERMITKTIK